MNLTRALCVGGLLAALPAWAVYAPIPEEEQGKDLLVTVKGGLSHDSNLFGAATNEVSSAIWEIAPRISYNSSVTDQTFISAAYGLTLEQFNHRPGDKQLDSHDVSVRVAHAFSQTSNIDVMDHFMVSRNPESLLAGIPLTPDQSFARNQLDGRYVRPLSPKIGFAAKARSVNYNYRNAALGRSLDRTENLFGLSGDYTIVPELKAVAEYRHQEIYYDKLGELKNKSSDYFMGGADYSIARKVAIMGRAGFESRRRKAEQDETAPYAEFSLKYDYADKSFLTAGYGFSLDETSDTTRFTDARINRFFVNVQHSVTALIVASGSLGWEPSQLQGRRGIGDVDEDTMRAGLAVTYLPRKNWMLSLTYDYDRVNSDDAVRDLRRQRMGFSTNYSF